MTLAAVLWPAGSPLLHWPILRSRLAERVRLYVRSQAGVVTLPFSRNTCHAGCLHGRPVSGCCAAACLCCARVYPWQSGLLARRVSPVSKDKL